jgi:hypothetical protein
VATFIAFEVPPLFKAALAAAKFRIGIKEKVINPAQKDLQNPKVNDIGL